MHMLPISGMYSMYFAKNMAWELSRLPKGDEVTGTPSPDVWRHCYDFFKAEYKDMYSVILSSLDENRQGQKVRGLGRG